MASDAATTSVPPAAADEHHGPAFLQHHFDTPAQQFNAAKLGMWVFLVQEILFFSGLFVAYGVYRSWYPDAFRVGSHLLNPQLGLINTCVLLFSSLTAALAVRSAQVGKEGVLTGKRWTSILIVVTIFCACVFMVVKYFEYTHKFHVGFFPGEHFDPTMEGEQELAAVMSGLGMEGAVPYHLRSFLGIYFVMTGVHGIHVLVGIGVLLWILKRNAKGEFGSDYFTPVDITALYWHLVDLIWIFLFPLLYLID